LQSSDLDTILLCTLGAKFVIERRTAQCDAPFYRCV